MKLRACSVMIVLLLLIMPITVSATDDGMRIAQSYDEYVRLTRQLKHPDMPDIAETHVTVRGTLISAPWYYLEDYPKYELITHYRTGEPHFPRRLKLDIYTEEELHEYIYVEVSGILHWGDFGFQFDSPQIKVLRDDYGTIKEGEMVWGEDAIIDGVNYGNIGELIYKFLNSDDYLFFDQPDEEGYWEYYWGENYDWYFHDKSLKYVIAENIIKEDKVRVKLRYGERFPDGDVPYSKPFEEQLKYLEAELYVSDIELVTPRPTVTGVSILDLEENSHLYTNKWVVMRAEIWSGGRGRAELYLLGEESKSLDRVPLEKWYSDIPLNTTGKEIGDVITIKGLYYGGRLHRIEEYIPAPTPTPTPTATPTSYEYNKSPEYTEQEPGFEATFAILGLLLVAYLMRRRR